MPTNEVLIARHQRVRDLLVELGPDKVELEYWLTRHELDDDGDDRETLLDLEAVESGCTVRSCGTTGCFAGFIATAIVEDPDFVRSAYVLVDSYMAADYLQLERWVSERNDDGSRFFEGDFFATQFADWPLRWRRHAWDLIDGGMAEPKAIHQTLIAILDERIAALTEGRPL